MIATATILYRRERYERGERESDIFGTINNGEIKGC
jgi:hypothetical protein